MPVRAPRSWSVARWAAIALVATSARQALADGPRGAEWASKDTIVYVEATHPKILLDRLYDPKMQERLAAIPQYEKFLKSPKFEELKNGVQFVSTLLDTKWDEGLCKLAGGGVVLAVEAEAGKGPAPFVVVTPSDPAFLTKAHAKLLEIARNDAKGKGNPDPVQQSSHRGVTIYSLGKDQSHAIVKDTLVISPSADLLKQVIGRALDGTRESLTSNPQWKARRAKVAEDTLAWGLVRLDRLREFDKKFVVPETPNPAAVFLFDSWIEAFRKAPWVAAQIRWTDANLGAEVALPTPPGGYSESIKKFLPPKGEAALAPLKPKGTIASLSLWRDVSAIWEVRNDLFPPEVVQGLAQLDTFAGQYFGGRDFGSGILGAIGPDWRLVVAEQDYTTIKPIPDNKLPAFALVIDLKPEDDDFAQRLKVAFQSFIGLANLGAAQSKAPPLELASETVEGVTIATSHFMAPKAAPGAKESVHQRQNYSPSAAQVDNHFVLSSSLGLTKDLIPVLRQPTKQTDVTAFLTADGPTLVHLLELNRGRLVSQNMLEKGNDKATASAQIDLLLGLLRYAGVGTLTARDNTDAVEFRLDFALGEK
jgi:hypothetical protein